MFWETFLALCNRDGIKPTPLVKSLGLPSGSVTDWKKGATPRDTTLIKIANYFGVSVDYLLGKERLENGDKEDSGEDKKMLAKQTHMPAKPAPTSPLSAEFYDLVDQLTLKELRELETIMKKMIDARK